MISNQEAVLRLRGGEKNQASEVFTFKTALTGSAVSELRLKPLRILW